jgi:presenilin-like A22 family membrane protease
MIIQNIMLTVFGGGLFIFVRDQPVKPPSSVAMQKVVRQSMLVVISEAFKERSYVILVAIFAMLDGAFVSFATVLSLFFSFYNVPGEKPVYNTGVVSAYGGVTAIFGVAASMACAVVLQKK